MDPSALRPMKDRRYQLVAVDSILVLNSRDREEVQFNENVKSVGSVGLLKPVLLNERFVRETGKYELVCGEGRLLAHRRLGKPEISAEIIDCDRKTAYLFSLIENIARVPADSMWFAREVKRLRDTGMTFLEISRIVGKSEDQVADYVSLVEKGEERLLRGVEEGVFPITFAVQVARSDKAQIQNLLMDAFDQGLVSTGNLRRVRQLIQDRTRGTPVLRKAPAREAGLAADSGKNEGETDYTVEELKRDIVETTRERISFVRETSVKEGRLFSLIETLGMLRTSEEFMTLLEAEGLAELPALQGDYGGLVDLKDEKKEEPIHG